MDYEPITKGLRGRLEVAVLGLSKHMTDGLLAECDNIDAIHRSLEAENAKLRELCAGLLTGYECGHGELCKGCTWDGLGDPKTFPCLPRVKARELGVEVDG